MHQIFKQADRTYKSTIDWDSRRRLTFNRIYFSKCSDCKRIFSHILRETCRGKREKTKGKEIEQEQRRNDSIASALKPITDRIKSFHNPNL